LRQGLTIRLTRQGLGNLKRGKLGPTPEPNAPYLAPAFGPPSCARLDKSGLEFRRAAQENEHQSAVGRSCKLHRSALASILATNFEKAHRPKNPNGEWPWRPISSS